MSVRKGRKELFDEYRAAVDVLSEHAKALKGLCGDAFDEAHERVNAAQQACDEARSALLMDSGDAEP